MSPETKRIVSNIFGNISETMCDATNIISDVTKTL